MKKGRLFLPTVADLVDSLSIDQIKMIKIKKYRNSYQREIERICHDIDLIISSKKKIEVNSRLMRIIITIALINIFIWSNKDEMQKNSEKYDHLLKLSHQLNGIRNQMKNLLLVEFGDTEPSLKRTNTDTEDLKDWDLKIK